MTAFRATLFDTLRLYLPDGRLLYIGSATTRSLIAYLLLNRQPIDRRRLAFTFWPDTIESAARRNLRQYLHHIRAALAPLDPQDTLLLTEGSSVQINPQAEISLDVFTKHAPKPRRRNSNKLSRSTSATCSPTSMMTGASQNENDYVKSSCKPSNGTANCFSPAETCTKPCALCNNRSRPNRLTKPPNAA